MDNQGYDIIVVGAGACGLNAALEMALTGKKVVVLEATDRIGGRIHTIYNDQFDQPVELGAEFIHGELKETFLISKKAGLKHDKVGGEIWQNEDGNLEEQEDFIEDYNDLNDKFKLLKKDISIKEFIETYLQEDKYEELRFTLKNYIEGYYAAETSKASTYALRDELNNSSDKQFRPEGGYLKLAEYLFRKCNDANVFFAFNEPVVRLEYEKDKITITTNKSKYNSKKALVTVSMGVLQSKTIQFVPGIPEKEKAALQLGFGPVVKTIFQFKEAFWKNKDHTQNKDLKKLGFMFARTIIPTWWTQYPKNSSMITGWSGGPHSKDLAGLSNEQVKEKGLESLSSIFKIPISELRLNLQGWHVINWEDDPYSRGAYSYDVVDGTTFKEIVKNPLLSTLFFAGEGLYEGIEIGTVEAALANGRDTAMQIVASF
jgi:Monoamine oxidase